jgi:hypothetical protein
VAEFFFPHSRHILRDVNGRDITALGYREGPLVGLALRVAKRAIKRMPRHEMDAALRENH